MSVIVPEVRFSKFKDSWLETSLKDVCKIERGRFSPRPRNDPKFYGGDIPFVQTGDVTNSNGSVATYTQTLNEEGLKVSKFFPKGTILITIAANIGYCGVLRVGMACPDSLIGLTPNKKNNNEFLCILLNRLRGRIDYLAPQAAQKNINIEFLAPFKLKVPCIQEQQEIADFLSSVDKKISLLKEKYAMLDQYKKGVMQKLFSQEIRFKDENGNDFPDWKQSKLGEHLVEYKERSQKENEHEVLTSSRTGLMKQSDYYSEGRITERSNKGFNVIPENHITFRSRSDDRKFFFNLNTLGFTGIISTYYPVFKMKNEQNGFFIELTRYHKNVFGKYAVGTSQVVLSTTEFLKIKLEFPCLEEQRKISDFAKELDKKLELVSQQIEQTQTFKKGLLQQMFV